MQKEIRARIEDPVKTAERLIEEAGAREIDIFDQVDVYYGSIDMYGKLGRFFLVRVREEDSRTMINYKSEVEENIWDEHETMINSPEEAKRIFEGMGLDNVLRVQKVRRSYEYEGMHVHIDSINQLGHFIEVKMDMDQHEEDDVYELLEKVDVPRDAVMDRGYVSELLQQEGSEYAEWCST